ncbi:MAG: hypothetical protein PHW59_13520 [Desulfobacterales bacterium]|nr:hypothetical protein [Desulfobacterales bacterium]
MKDDTVLDRWGLIANYLKVSVMTALRYRRLGLPITYDPAGHPITTPAKLDRWRCCGKSQSDPA